MSKAEREWLFFLGKRGWGGGAVLVVCGFKEGTTVRLNQGSYGKACRDLPDSLAAKDSLFISLFKHVLTGPGSAKVLHRYKSKVKVYLRVTLIQFFFYILFSCKSFPFSLTPQREKATRTFIIRALHQGYIVLMLALVGRIRIGKAEAICSMVLIKA